MSRWLREIKKGMIALAALTLLLQGALPVRAYAADTTEDTETREEEESDREEPDTEGSNYESSDYESSDQDSYILDYFDRIAVNSVSGKLTIRSGEDFSISFPAGGDHNPGFSVQDDILVVSGRKGGSEAEKNADGSAVILGEDEPTESGTQDAAAEALNAEGSGQKNGEKAEDLPLTWNCYQTPMAGHFEWVFYRHRKSGDILVLPYLNGSPVPLQGLPAINGHFYSWDDICHRIASL